jgi:K+-sensing histidine kinase KdpD
LEVLDNGNGFSENALEKLFDYFPSEDVLHHHEGFGLGLAAARLIMDVHSGEIQASNRADNPGASVRLIFKDYRKIGL